MFHKMVIWNGIFDSLFDKLVSKKTQEGGYEVMWITRVENGHSNI